MERDNEQRNANPEREWQGEERRQRSEGEYKGDERRKAGAMSDVETDQEPDQSAHPQDPDPEATQH